MSRKSPTRWLFLALTLVMALASFSAFAQRSDGNIGGNATPGDTVTAVNTGTGLKREVVVDEDGKYRLSALPLGEYTVSIAREGTPVANFKLNVRPGVTTRIPTVSAASPTPVASQPAPAN
jgi:hypothetical protein